MEIRRAADALLRSQTSPLPAFLTPSVLRWHPQYGKNFSSISTKSNKRSFSASTAVSAVRSSVTTSSSKSAVAPKTEEPEHIAASLDWIKAGMGGNRTSRFNSLNTTTDQRSTKPQPSTPQDELDMNKGNSASDLLRAVNIQRGVGSHQFNLNRMRDPSPRPDAAQLMKDISSFVAPPEKPHLRLTPTTGRTVSIGAGVDVGRGFQILEMTVARNSVRKDMNRQRFHERGGLKRKRLRRERWRKRFMVGFKATVSRVKELKAQGW